MDEVKMPRVIALENWTEKDEEDPVLILDCQKNSLYVGQRSNIVWADILFGDF